MSEQPMTARVLDELILNILEQFSNPRDCNQIAALISGVGSRRVSSRLAALRKRNRVVQVAGGRGTNPATYLPNRDA